MLRGVDTDSYLYVNISLYNRGRGNRVASSRLLPEWPGVVWSSAGCGGNCGGNHESLALVQGLPMAQGTENAGSFGQHAIFLVPTCQGPQVFAGQQEGLRFLFPRFVLGTPLGADNRRVVRQAPPQTPVQSQLGLHRVGASNNPLSGFVQVQLELQVRGVLSQPSEQGQVAMEAVSMGPGCRSLATAFPQLGSGLQQPLAACREEDL